MTNIHTRNLSFEELYIENPTSDKIATNEAKVSQTTTGSLEYDYRNDPSP